MLALAVAIFLGAWGIPPSFHPQPAQQEEHNQQIPGNQQTNSNPEMVAQDKEQENHWEAPIRWLDEHGGSVTAFSTFVIAAFAAALFIATYKLWKAGERHSERELRAYLSVGPLKVQNFGPNQTTEVTFHIKNNGKTPAYRITNFGFLLGAPFPATTFPTSIWVPTTASMGPGETRDTWFPMSQPLTPEQHTAILNGTFALYVSFEVRYWDAFGKVERFSQYRAFYRGTGTALGVLKFEQTPEHNDSN